MDNESNGKLRGVGGPASEQTNKSSKKSHLNRRPPAAAYQKVARQPNNPITAGVLSDRSRVTRAITDLQGQISHEMATKFNEGVAEIEQQIIGATISLKGRKGSQTTHTNNFLNGGQRGSGGGATSSTIDHTQLMVQNSPRNGGQNTRSAINYQARQQPGLDRDSAMHEQAMDPVFKHSSNLNTTNTANLRPNSVESSEMERCQNTKQHRSQLMSSQEANRSKKKSMIKVMDSQERDQLIGNRKSTQQDLMSGSQPELSSVHMIKTNVSKQQNSVTDTDYRQAKGLHGSASPAQTQQLGGQDTQGQSSAFSEHMRENADSLCNKNIEENQTDAKGGQQQIVKNSKVKSGEHTFGNAPKEPPTIEQNPLNVHSFVSGKNPSKLSMPPQNIPPTVAVRKGAKAPTAEEQVFKVQDLIKSDGATASELSTLLMLQQQMLHNQNIPSSRYKAGYIKQVMRAPKMPTFEQLKRGKHNNKDVTMARAIRTQSNPRGFHISSHRDAHMTMQSAINSEEAFRAAGRRQATLNSSTDLDTSLRDFVLQPGPNSIQAHPGTQHGFREKKVGQLGNHQRLASQGNSQRPTMVSGQMTSTTSPTRASKKFAGGFGGVGSIYTHSHLTNTRKQSISHYATPGHQAAVPMKITAGRNQQLNNANQNAKYQDYFETSAGRAGSPDSLDISGSELRVAGNRTGLPQYLLDKQAQQTSYFQARNGSMQNKDHMVSQDTSRSPVPIDAETFKDMNKQLPRRMAGSSMQGYVDNSVSRDVSCEPSSSHSRIDKNNADISQFTQLQPFIMSPRNLADILRKQQEAIRVTAEQRALQTKNSQAFKNAQLRGNNNHTLPASQSPRNVFSHQGWRNRPPGLHKLGTLNADQDFGFQSSNGLLVEATQKARHATLGSHESVAQKHSNGPAFSMGIEGQSIKNPALTQESVKLGYSLQQLQQQNDDLDAVSQGQNSQKEAAILDYAENDAKDTLVELQLKNSLPIGGEPRSDVNIRISKINIAITEGGSKPYFGEDHTFGELPNDEKGSELTNYRDQEQIGGIFDSEGKQFEAEATDDGKNTDRAVANMNLNPASRQFEPVLKSKSYLSNVQTPSQGSGDNNFALNEFQETMQSKERIEGGAFSLKGDPDTTAILSDDNQKQFEPYDTAPIHQQQNLVIVDAMSQPQLACAKPETSQTSHALSALHVSRTQNRSRSGAGQSSSYDHGDNLAPRLVNKSGAIYTVTNSNVMINQDVEVNTDLIGHLSAARVTCDDDDKSSSVYVDNKEVKGMLKFDRDTWNHCQEVDLGTEGFVARKTVEFMDTMKKMATLDHNTHTSDRYSKVQSKADRMMKGIAITAQTNFANSTLSHSTNTDKVFDKTQLQKMRFRTKIPIAMIHFKNKSEQTRYMRVASCIMALRNSSLQPSHNEVEHIYMKIFRFLADILTPEEFQYLKYYHVSRFIGNILTLASNGCQEVQADQKMSLRMFICLSLDLGYIQTQNSQNILQQAHFSMSQKARNNIENHWSKTSDNKNIDVNSVYSERNMSLVSSFELKTSAEDRHQQIQEQIKKTVKTFAHEPVLPSVVRNKFFKEKEQIKRQTLARLLKHQKKQNDIDYGSLAKQSVIARNHIVAEHVIASRNMRQWRDDAATEIHVERRHFDRRKTKSMIHEHHAEIIQRIY